jgi:hypothetical protein
LTPSFYSVKHSHSCMISIHLLNQFRHFLSELPLTIGKLSQHFSNIITHFSKSTINSLFSYSFCSRFLIPQFSTTRTPRTLQPFRTTHSK